MESVEESFSCTQFVKSHILLLQVMRESISGTTSPVRASECAMKSGKKISLLCCRWHYYSCCALVTIQTATNLWYSFVVRCYLYNYTVIVGMHDVVGVSLSERTD